MKEPFSSNKTPNPAIGRILFFLLLFTPMLLGLHGSFAAEQIPVKRVHVIYGLNPNFPAHQLFTKGLQNVFGQSSDKFQIEYSFEYLDLGLGRADENYRTLLAEFLKRKYLLKPKPDLIIAHLTPANLFLVKHVEEIMPGVPVIFTGDQPGMIPAKDIPSNFAGIVREGNPAPAVSLILQAQPDTGKIYIVMGDSPQEKKIRLSFPKALAMFANKVEMVYLNQLTFPQMMETIKGISGPSVILYISYFQDITGQNFVPAKVAGIISRAANVPTYGISAPYLGQGVVGGYQFSAGVVGEKAAELGTKILLGSKISDFPREQTAATAEYRFDWRALKRWGIDENRLPRESKFEYRTPTFWDAYKRHIIGGLILVLVETFLILLLLINIKKRKKVEEVLRESEEQYRILFENAGEAIFVALDGKMVFGNPMTVTITGHSGEEITSRPFVDFIHVNDREMVIDRHARRIKGESIPPRYSFRILHKDGGFRWVELDAVIINWKGRPATLNFMSDITDRKRAEEALKEREDFYRSLIENSWELITIMAVDGTILFESSSSERILGYPPQELVGKNALEYIHPDDLEKAVAALSPEPPGETQRSIETRFRHRNGSWLYLEADGRDLREHPSVKGIIINSRDITRRKLSEEKEKETHALLRIAGEKAKLGGWSVNLQENRVIWSDEVAAIHEMPPGYSPSVEQGISFYPPEWRERITKVFTDCAQKGIPYNEEMEIITAGGKRVWVRTIGEAVKNDAGKIIKVQGAFQDITDRKQAEDAVRRSEEKYRTIIEEMVDGYFEVDLAGNYTFVNEAETKNMGYSRDELIGMNNRQYQDEKNAKKTYQAFRRIYETGEPVKSLEVAIIRKDGTIGVNEISVSLKKDHKGRPIGFQGFTHDITDRKISMEQLRKALGGTVQAVALMVESKDPYTAGHQRRVADLSRAIAREMGLSQERIESLRVAGTIHDIGKVSVPAEILAMPRKLTNLEYSLIQTHAQSGYDILKDIEFPWPIARMVLEHHERMNGSGYPNGLTGEQILLESRILAVADVVEAMATHRPYRSALGLDKALEEITQNKGLLYDPEAVDACLRLFREKGFTIQE
jgi:PAS domain S-box-containing protein